MADISLVYDVKPLSATSVPGLAADLTERICAITDAQGVIEADRPWDLLGENLKRMLPNVMSNIAAFTVLISVVPLTFESFETPIVPWTLGLTSALMVWIVWRRSGLFLDGDHLVIRTFRGETRTLIATSIIWMDAPAPVLSIYARNHMRVDIVDLSEGRRTFVPGCMINPGVKGIEKLRRRVDDSTMGRICVGLEMLTDNDVKTCEAVGLTKIALMERSRSPWVTTRRSRTDIPGFVFQTVASAPSAE